MKSQYQFVGVVLPIIIQRKVDGNVWYQNLYITATHLLASRIKQKRRLRNSHRSFGLREQGDGYRSHCIQLRSRCIAARCSRREWLRASVSEFQCISILFWNPWHIQSVESTNVTSIFICVAKSNCSINKYFQIVKYNYSLQLSF